MATPEVGLNRAFIVYGTDDQLYVDGNDDGINDGDEIRLGSKSMVEAYTDIEALPEGQLEVKITKDDRDYFFLISLVKDAEGNESYVAVADANNDAFGNEDVHRLVIQGVIQNQTDLTGQSTPVQVAVTGQYS
jgi:hypothetical protein